MQLAPDPCEKEYAADSLLAATEIVRRCERRIGELVRDGQDRGEIRKSGGDTRTDLVHRDVLGLSSPSDATGITSKSEMSLHYAMADAPDEQFEQAIEDAKAEGNLDAAIVLKDCHAFRVVFQLPNGVNVKAVQFSFDSTFLGTAQWNA